MADVMVASTADWMAVPKVASMEYLTVDYLVVQSVDLMAEQRAD